MPEVIQLDREKPVFKLRFTWLGIPCDLRRLVHTIWQGYFCDPRLRCDFTGTRKKAREGGWVQKEVIFPRRPETHYTPSALTSATEAEGCMGVMWRQVQDEGHKYASWPSWVKALMKKQTYRQKLEILDSTRVLKSTKFGEKSIKFESDFEQVI